MPIAKKCWLPALLVLATFWLAFSNTLLGDYGVDAAFAVESLSHLRIAAYLTAHPLMGPFPPLLETPFAALGTTQVGIYQWACVPCLLAVSGLGLYLGRCALRRGGGPVAGVLISLICLINPVTIEALQNGHPEELLTAALAVAAVVTAAEGHERRAAVLLGLAFASKQWAVIALFPMLMVLPGRRIRATAIAAGIAAFLSLPALIADPSGFFGVQSAASAVPRAADIWSAWYPVSPVSGGSASGITLTHYHTVPVALQPLAHPLVAAAFVAVPLALWAWRGRFELDGGDAMALLCLLALLRCALDPADNLYYHAPLLLALVGWDAVSPGRLPLRALAGTVLALLFFSWSRNLGDQAAFNAAYLAVVGAAALAIAVKLTAGGRENAAPRLSRSPRPA